MSANDREHRLREWEQLRSICAGMADEVLQATLVECGWNVAMAVDRVFEGRYTDPTQHLLDQFAIGIGLAVAVAADDEEEEEEESDEDEEDFSNEENMTPDSAVPPNFLPPSEQPIFIGIPDAIPAQSRLYVASQHTSPRIPGRTPTSMFSPTVRAHGPSTSVSPHISTPPHGQIQLSESVEERMMEEMEQLPLMIRPRSINTHGTISSHRLSLEIRSEESTSSSSEPECRPPVLWHDDPCEDCDYMESMKRQWRLPSTVVLMDSEGIPGSRKRVRSTTSLPDIRIHDREPIEDDCISLPDLGECEMNRVCRLWGLPKDHPGFRPPCTEGELASGMLSDDLIVLCFPLIFERVYGRPAPTWLPFYAHQLPPYPLLRPYMTQCPPRIVSHPAPGELDALLREARERGVVNDARKLADVVRTVAACPDLVWQQSSDQFGAEVSERVPYSRGYTERSDRDTIADVPEVEAEIIDELHLTEDSSSPVQAEDIVVETGPRAAYSFLRKKMEEKVECVEVTEEEEEVGITDDDQHVDVFESKQFDMDVSVQVPIPYIHVEVLLTVRELLALFKKCGVLDAEVRDVCPVPRAEYEEKALTVTVRLRVDVKGSSAQPYWLRQQITLFELAVRFCTKSSFGLHDQPYLSLPIDQFFTSHHLVHLGVSVKCIQVGNAVNPGLFFVRGEYFSHYNINSNSTIHPHRNDTSQQTFAAGKKPLLSYANFEHDRRQLHIFFAMKIAVEDDGLECAGYMMNISYSSITSVQVDLSHPNENVVYLHIRHPPQLWEAVPRTQSSGQRFLNMDTCKEWVRVLQWPGGQHYSGCSQQALATSPCIAISTMKVSLPGTMQETTLFDRLCPNRELMEVLGRVTVRSGVPLQFSAVKAVRRRIPITENIPNLGSFRLNYALHAMITRGSRVTDQLFDLEEKTEEELTATPFFTRVRHAFEECPEACETAMENLLCAIDERRIVHLLDAFDHIYGLRLSAVKRALMGAARSGRHARDMMRVEGSDVPANCVLVRKVMVTPLRVMFMAPEVMMTNRVVRHFGEEYALRCVFRDDSGYRLQVKDFYKGSCGALQDQPPLIANVVRNTMTRGLTIVDRHYEFLAWSNSQMRDHGCYMYAPKIDPLTKQPMFTIEQMREWMGDFSVCRSVPKMMSRMGQCFTQAQPTIKLRRDEWTVEDDCEGGVGHPDTHEPYCFSDGVGRIGYEHAVMLAVALQLPYVPSCYQLRFKGFKGVLAVDPTLDKRRGPRVVFRKSQEKFHDTQNGDSVLEVVKYAMFSPVCLNRPLITVIDHVAAKQGADVHSRVCRRIHGYLEKELNTLSKMLIDEKDAAEGLTQRVVLPINFRRVLRCGITITDEPFLRRLLTSIYRYCISQHLSKAKIFLPAHLGRTVYGLFDDSGLLQHGQVFIQYSVNRSKGKFVEGQMAMPVQTKVHKGRVLVSKNPCRVAGDCRVFDAVEVPALTHLYDVIVFPRYGPRPHPDEMAGSDLDGDEYSIIFDTDCMFDHNEQAMNFPQNKAEQFEEMPSTSDMVAFFLRYLSQDSVGRLSNAHLQAADLHGLFSDVANSIALKCAVAVDFPKTGVPAEQLFNHEQSDAVPDYMAHHSKPMFLSQWLNGQLYRKVKKIEDILELTERVPSVVDGAVDQLFLPEGFDPFEDEEEHKETIEHLYREYCSKLQSLLDEYGIGDEAQLVSGHILTLKRITAMERDDYSFYHTDKIVELRYSFIFDYFRKQFFKEFGDEEDFMQDAGNGLMEIRCDSVMERRAVQWYSVAYGSADRRFLSFPWVVWDVLAHAKRTRLSSSSRFSIPCNSRISAILTEKARRLREFDIYFDELISEIELAYRYAMGYGPGMRDVIYILNSWIKQDGFEEICPLRLEHLIALFIQFGHGIKHGKDHSFADTTPILFPTKLMYGDPFCTSPVGTLDYPGEAVIHFLTYLSSESFLQCDELDLDLMDGNPSPSLLTRSDYWMPLSQLAYKTVHEVSVSGRFGSLGIGDSLHYSWTQSESRQPTIVSMQLFEGVDHRLVCSALQEWSGSESVSARFAQNRWFVSCIGSVLARQRLSRLLLTDAVSLRAAVQSGVPPDIAPFME